MSTYVPVRPAVPTNPIQKKQGKTFRFSFVILTAYLGKLVGIMDRMEALSRFGPLVLDT